MKLGIIIKQGLEKEVAKEYQDLLQKAKEGYGDMVTVLDGKSFKIKDKNIEITFSMDNCLSKFAIYQIFE